MDPTEIARAAERRRREPLGPALRQVGTWGGHPVIEDPSLPDDFITFANVFLDELESGDHVPVPGPMQSLIEELWSLDRDDLLQGVYFTCERKAQRRWADEFFAALDDVSRGLHR
jgi:hypothetical protein